MEGELSLQKLVKVVYKRKWLAVAILVLSVLLVTAISLLMKPVYSASAVLRKDVARQDCKTQESLAELITSDEYVSQAVKKLNLDSPKEVIRQNIAVTYEEPTIVITAYSTKPEKAKELANFLAKHFVEEDKQRGRSKILQEQVEALEKELAALDVSEKRLQKIYDQAETEGANTTTEKFIKFINLDSLRMHQAEIQRNRASMKSDLFNAKVALEATKIEIESLAEKPARPVRPNLTVNLVFSLLVGLIIGIVVVIVMEFLEAQEQYA